MKKGEATRAKLIEGALQVLLKEGVFGATTRKIADASGQELAALHYHFKNKEELLFAVLEEVALILKRYLDGELKPVPDLVKCVEELITVAWRMMEGTRDLQILQFEMTFYAVRRPNAAWLAKKQYQGLVEQYESILAERPPYEIDRTGVEILAQFIIAGLDGILVQELAHPDEARSSESLKCLNTAAQAMAGQILTFAEPKAS